MGVKSLWQLLEPVGRPIMLENVEGKSMAIDSSIWIYQFQATMRGKDGRVLVNAHVLGFLRRISKLLFYGIKPVFVFDGGAPALKRATIAERKLKKAGAAADHAKVAEKLLAATMRREAISHAQKAKSTKGKGKETATIDDDTVYLEDLEGPTSPTRSPNKPSASKPDPSPSKTNAKFHDHDPFRLPELDLPAAVAKATMSKAAPDPRLATEDELRAFVDNMRPEDLDITSDAFRELPTEVQYEIVGDLRLRSRQTSHDRLQRMLRAAPTPMDFSKQQILNLKQRNTLTQQLLTTTDSIGKAHVTIPVRIASERNKEYVLIKNEGVDGGWILGIREEGNTQDKPIKIDHESEDERELAKNDEDDDDDDDMEEVAIPAAPDVDPDLREYQREMALAAISRRPSGKGLAPISREPKPKPSVFARPELALFDENDNSRDDEDDLQIAEDVQLAQAIAASIDDNHAHSSVASTSRQGNVDADDEDEEMELAYAVASSLEYSCQPSSKPPSSRHPQTPSRPGAATTSITGSTPRTAAGPSAFTSAVSVSDLSLRMQDSPNRLETALAIAGAGMRRTSGSLSTSVQKQKSMMLPAASGSPLRTPTPKSEKPRSMLGKDKDELGESLRSSLGVGMPTSASVTVGSSSGADVEFTGKEEEEGPSIFGKPSLLLSSAQPSLLSTTAYPPSTSQSPGLKESITASSNGSKVISSSPKLTGLVTAYLNTTDALKNDSDDENMEEDTLPIVPMENNTAPSTEPKPLDSVSDEEDEDDMEEVQVDLPIVESTTNGSLSMRTFTSEPSISSKPAKDLDSSDDDDSDTEQLIPWSRSPSPDANDTSFGQQQLLVEEKKAKQDRDEAWDAAQEIDVRAEEGDFARFVSQVKGQDLDAVRREIDEEIKSLNQQKKVALRDSEEVTQHMVAQIMTLLRLFGIPYITAPMEAEAQCAELLQLGLVDGIITDDSDVFLFGGQRVFKNMFNQSKTVECFLLADLARELGLDRGTLVRLAYLLGSDYVDGLPGVGPVVAMELLKEFPGDDGLHKFKDWWTRVQMGKDRPEESGSPFRKRFKRKFKELYLAPEWPNPAVRDAYYHPAVDSSEEPFKWGLPDLDALRHFLNEELGWRQDKVDELILPIIQRMTRRSHEKNRQGNLNEFFDISTGTGTHAPRKRQAYQSKRLQQVVNDFRKQNKQQGRMGSVSRSISATPAPEDFVDEDAASSSSAKPAPRKRKAGGGAEDSMTRSNRGRDRGKGRGRGSTRAANASRKRKRVDEDENESQEQEAASKESSPNGTPPPSLRVELRPRPKPKPVASQNQGESESSDGY